MGIYNPNSYPNSKKLIFFLMEEGQKLILLKIEYYNKLSYNSEILTLVYKKKIDKLLNKLLCRIENINFIIKKK